MEDYNQPINNKQGIILQYDIDNIKKIKHSFITSNYSGGTIFFVSKKRVSEIELLGLIAFIKDSLEEYKGLGIVIRVFNAVYYKDEDSIQERLFNNYSAENASSEIKCIFKNSSKIKIKTIIGINISAEKRLRKILSKAKITIQNDFDIELQEGVKIKNERYKQN